MTTATRTVQNELEIVELTHRDLGLQYKQIARIVGADESTLHRWMSGTTPSGPRQVYRSRLAALRELYDELRAAFRSFEAARKWFWEDRPPSFRGATPAELVLDGRIERVTGLLENFENGVLS
jgi:hypothetical protein